MHEYVVQNLLDWSTHHSIQLTIAGNVICFSLGETEEVVAMPLR